MQQGGGVPLIDARTIAGPFDVAGVKVIPVTVMHGRMPILGFRFGRFAYLTDCNAIPDSSRPLLQDLDVLVIDALRFRPHSTHFSVDEAVAASRELAPKKTYLTHICHDLAHATVNAGLPDGVELAYDGLALDVLVEAA